ncbi:DUF1697 domain-containing protein [Yinghuangia soli]|uniref:DUF1697 domain-containing protein n=1 Tax=Yinghuangia soli TaxID=2908204 RepID=A0AA41Q158_9ACTN|nr:DUF1697 domain-containing protein [Yinghuangia soli]MCF2529593.1 DUF1697 domain-containing protein [Yinghuangia soli]
MSRYIALLRGVNVGGGNKVPMAELRALLADLGYTSVKTLLQSGNAVFTVPAGPADSPGQVTEAVEKALEKQYGRTISVMVRTPDELRAVMAANPLTVGHPSRFLVNFYAGPVDAERLAGFDAEAHAPDRFAVAGREIYYDFPDGMGNSKLPAAIDRTLKTLGTARNWNTVTKLLAIADEE